MLVVAAVQIVRVGALGYGAPDRGGGFGMFAAVDKSNNRFMRAILRTTDGRSGTIAVLPETDIPTNDLYRALSDPTSARLQDVARTLADRLNSATDPSAPKIASVRLEVFRILYDEPTTSIRRDLAAQHFLELTP